MVPVDTPVTQEETTLVSGSVSAPPATVSSLSEAVIPSSLHAAVISKDVSAEEAITIAGYGNMNGTPSFLLDVKLSSSAEPIRLERSLISFDMVVHMYCECYHRLSVYPPMFKDYLALPPEVLQKVVQRYLVRLLTWSTTQNAPFLQTWLSVPSSQLISMLQRQTRKNMAAVKSATLADKLVSATLDVQQWAQRSFRRFASDVVTGIDSSPAVKADRQKTMNEAQESSKDHSSQASEVQMSGNQQETAEQDKPIQITSEIAPQPEFLEKSISAGMIDTFESSEQYITSQHHVVSLLLNSVASVLRSIRETIIPRTAESSQMTASLVLLASNIDQVSNNYPDSDLDILKTRSIAVTSCFNAIESEETRYGRSGMAALAEVGEAFDMCEQLDALLSTYEVSIKRATRKTAVHVSALQSVQTQVSQFKTWAPPMIKEITNSMMRGIDLLREAERFKFESLSQAWVSNASIERDICGST